MIEAKSLTKKFGDFVALREVSFRIGRGEIVGLLGPNGAGKTTTLRLLAGFFPPTSGSALIEGDDLTKNRRATKRKIGYLPENVPLYPDLTVEESVALAAGLQGIVRAERKDKVEQALGRADLLEVRKKLGLNLSKGFRQRVGLACAIVHEPPVLILDEPTIGLDPRQIREVRDLILTFKENRAILLSSHILQEIAAVCQRALIIDRGRIVADRSIAGLGALQLEELFLNALAH